MSTRSWKLLAPLLVLTGIIACSEDDSSSMANGGRGGGVGGSGVTIGSITAFGSVFVNGIEFATDEARIEVDEQAAVESDLRVGMVVTITGTVNPDELTGTAESIVFDEEVEGPVGDLTDVLVGSTKTFVVLGITVVVENGVTVFTDDGFAGFSFDTLADNDVVEVSGFIDQDARLRATHIKKTGTLTLGATRIEVKGVISGLVDSDTLTLQTDSATLTVNFDASTNMVNLPNGVPELGLFVQVTGILADDVTITADRVKLQKSALKNNANADIEGFVTDFNGLNDFKVNSQTVDASTANFKPTTLAESLTDGLLVRVKGRLVDGVVDARKVDAVN